MQTFCTCTHAAPCGNTAPDGCANSTGQGGRLSQAAGSSSVAADDLVLSADLLPDSTFGLLIMGAHRAPARTLGDGLRCIGPPLYRFQVAATAAGAFDAGPGLVGYSQAHFPPAGGILVGQTWRFQAWYRTPRGRAGGRRTRPTGWR